MSEAKEKKAREPKKNSIPMADVKALASTIPQYEKASFLVVGSKDGVRLALPLTSGVSRAYFYGCGDYSLIPSHEAITVFSAEERKEQRRGGIMAEVDFSKGPELARSALEALIEVVRAAPPPAKKEKKAKVPAQPKVNAAGLTDDEVLEIQENGNDGSDADTAEA